MRVAGQGIVPDSNNKPYKYLLKNQYIFSFGICIFFAFLVAGTMTITAQYFTAEVCHFLIIKRNYKDSICLYTLYNIIQIRFSQFNS